MRESVGDRSGGPPLIGRFDVAGALPLGLMLVPPDPLAHGVIGAALAADRDKLVASRSVSNCSYEGRWTLRVWAWGSRLLRSWRVPQFREQY
jgi:hypothetical protein